MGEGSKFMGWDSPSYNRSTCSLPSLFLTREKINHLLQIEKFVWQCHVKPEDERFVGGVYEEKRDMSVGEMVPGLLNMRDSSIITGGSTNGRIVFGAKWRVLKSEVLKCVDEGRKTTYYIDMYGSRFRFPIQFHFNSCTLG